MSRHPDAGSDDRVAADAALPEPAPLPRWSRARQDLAIVLWTSFLVAAAATMFFFAAFDPVALGEQTALAGLFATANAGYALGFFFFWLIAAGSSALSMYLARTQRADRSATIGSAPRDTP